MAYSMALNAIYNQYLTTYAPRKSDTRFDTHKKSELRGITNSMAQVNKDAPLYKFVNDGSTREYIVGLKEESRMLQNTIASVIGDSDSTTLDGKVAYSSDESIASARYVGTEENSEEEQVMPDEAESKDIALEVKSLATPQVNRGRFLQPHSLGLQPGDYSFDLTVNGQGYEFQYTVRQGDTNTDVQHRLSRLINNSGIPLKAFMDEDPYGNTSLRVESKQVGVHSGENSRVFNITDATNEGGGSVAFLGIDRVVQEAANASFIIDGEEGSSYSNTFVVDGIYEVSLRGVTSEKPITIGLKPDTEAAVDNINQLVGGINQFIRNIHEYTRSQSRANGLLGEIRGIAGAYREGMERMGITFDEEGAISVDRDRLNSSILDGTEEEAVGSLRGFANAMMDKGKEVSLNPINYLNKTVVEYKNPGKNFVSPYVASAYAGMMFNYYC